MKKVSKKQMNVFNILKESIETTGYPPSIRELCELVGVTSTSTIHGHLKQLEEKGYIRRDLSKPRAIEILYHSETEPDTSSIKMIPLLGKVAAGAPILATENIESYVPFPRYDVDDGEYFMLEISGDSMIEVGILDGDNVLVKSQNTANNGDIVIALLGDYATCKTYYLEENYVRLQPENSALEPIYTPNPQILGIVKGLNRRI